MASTDVYSALKATISWFFQASSTRVFIESYKMQEQRSHVCFRALTFARSFGLAASCSNNFLGSRQMLMHEKTSDPYIQFFHEHGVLF